MYTVKELSKKSGLSRTALLYYESIALLSAESRSESNYRLYSEDSVRCLERICIYRDAGVPLNEIANILSFGEDAERIVLEKTLSMLNQKAKEIRASQENIAALLHRETEPGFLFAGIDTKKIFSSLVQLGIGEDVFLQIHEILEKNSPDSHLTVLKMLGFNEDEINRIRTGVNSNEGKTK